MVDIGVCGMVENKFHKVTGSLTMLSTGLSYWDM